MLYSNLFGKASKTTPAEAFNISYKFLYRAGFIRESTPGRFYFLPLGQRVQKKIMKTVKKEMDNTGAQEILFSLSGTTEEMFIDATRKFQMSYRDLPFNIYQFFTTFRDEPKTKGGLLQAREFVSKDAYSFHVNELDFKKEYQNMREAYLRIFKNLGLKPVVAEANNGYIGDGLCHTFIVGSPIGECIFFVSEDNNYVAHEDVAKFKREPVNLNEPKKPFKIIEQPKWVQTMDDNVKHYKLPKSRFLKNVVYKNKKTSEIIIAAIRGDLEVSKVKLERAIDAVGQLEDATDEDLEKIGTKTGYVHSWGHKKARYIGDLSLTSVKNFIGGQKKDKTDSINVNYGRDFECESLEDIAQAKDGFIAENRKQKLVAKQGIEVGTIFQLGNHYTSKMKGATFIDKDGKEKHYHMGHYRIDIGRIMAVIVEMYHDDKGIIWPEHLAPFQVHLIGLDLKDQTVRSKAHKLYTLLAEKNVEVLYDDRPDVSAGEKFSDADLIGIPVRLVVSKRTGEKIEYKKRSESQYELVTFDALLARI